MPPTHPVHSQCRRHYPPRSTNSASPAIRRCRIGAASWNLCTRAPAEFPGLTANERSLSLQVLHGGACTASSSPGPELACGDAGRIASARQERENHDHADRTPRYNCRHAVDGHRKLPTGGHLWRILWPWFLPAYGQIVPHLL